MKQKTTLTNIILPTFFLCCIGLLLYANINEYMDVLFWDEANYLVRSEMFWHHIPKTWGPTYSLWYKLLSYIESDKINLYYFNYALLGIINPILCYWILLRLKVNSFFAFFISVMFLLHPLNVETWPRISHYCVMIIFITILLSTYIKENSIKAVLFCLCFLFLAFARPEFYLTFLMSLILLAFVFFKERKVATKFSYASFAFLVVCFMLSYKIFKTPFNNGDSGRSIGVFYQHFAWNYTQWTNSNAIFWLDFYTIIHQVFGNKIDLLSIIQNDNGLFWKHIGVNLLSSIKSVLYLIVGLFVPLKAIHYKLVLFISSILVFVIVWLKKENEFKLDFNFIKKHFVVFLFISASIIPPLFFSIYAYPRSHYLYLLFPSVILSIAFLFQSFKIKHSFVFIVILFLVVVLFPLKAKHYNYFNMFRKEQIMCNLNTLKYLKQTFNSKDSTSILDVEGNISSLLPRNFYNINYLSNQNTKLISQFIQEKQPKIIYVTPTLLSLNIAKEDTLLSKICLKPEQYGYIPIKTGKFKPYLLIKK